MEKDLEKFERLLREGLKNDFDSEEKRIDYLVGVLVKNRTSVSIIDEELQKINKPTFKED